jgi:hypothetical protein
MSKHKRKGLPDKIIHPLGVDSPPAKVQMGERCPDVDGYEEKIVEEMLEAVGTNDASLAVKILFQAAKVSFSEDFDGEIDTAVAIFHALKPQDLLESMLMAQMVGVHNLAMENMSQATLSGLTLEQVSQKINRATKLMRTYAIQMETLNRHRRKGSQTVKVEHITINGGQAIVGSSIEGRGRGDS